MMITRQANNLSRSLSNASQAFFMKLAPISSARIFSKTQNSSVPTSKFSDCKANKNSTDSCKQEKTLPISPLLGPYPFTNPKVADQKLYWCSCGLSKAQPFCDGKHKGTEFKPLKFTLEDTVQSVNLCGCKLTKTAPFCDEKTCKNCTSEAPQKKE